MHLLKWLDRLTPWSITLCTFLVPLWFLPFTIDVLELPKQTLLIILVMIGLLAWLGQSILRRSFSLARSWLHLAVVVFLIGYLATSFASIDRYLSFAGNFGQMQWAFTTVFGFVIFYFLIANNVKGLGRVYNLLLLFLASAVLVGVIGLLQLIGLFPFARVFPASATPLFNTIGNANALASFLVIPVVLATSLLVLGCKEDGCLLNAQGSKTVAAKALVWAVLIVGLSVAVLVDFWVVWAGLLFGTAVVIGISLARSKKIGHPTTLVAPIVVGLLSVALLFLQTPLKLPIAGEVLPSASHTWNIAKAVLVERPLFGSGPGTWIMDYSKFRALSANVSPYWANRFDRGISTALSLPAMVGIIGVAAWLILVLSAIVKSASHLVRERNDALWQAVLTVFASWATIVFLSLFTNDTLAHQFAFWFFFALLAALVGTGTFRWEKRTRPFLVSVLSIVFLVLSVSAISWMWLMGQRLVAEANYSTAVLEFQNGKSIEASIAHLNAAVALNRLNDVTYRNLSQAYLINLARVVQGPDPEKGRVVNQLLRASIDTAKRATELSPVNVDNWTNLAVVYQTIAPYTRGADEFAIVNYREALKREPNNPVFYNEIGKLFILRADAYRTLVASKDETTRKEAEANMRAELEKAAVELNQAIQVKPDYASAHYNLGILYERQGRIKDAIMKLEQVLQANNQDVGVGFQLALLYYQNHESTRATEMLKQILRLDPSYANAHWYLSAIYEENGKIDEAIVELETLKRAMPDNVNVLNRLNALVKAREEKRQPNLQIFPEPLKEEIKSPQPRNEVKK